MPSKFIVPINFKTLVTPASVLVLALPFDSPKLPLQVIQVKAASAVVQVGAAASVNVVSQPSGPTQPSAFQVIQVRAGGGVGTYYQAIVYPLALKEPSLPLQVISVKAQPPVVTVTPGQVIIYGTGYKEPQLPPNVIVTSQAFDYGSYWGYIQVYSAYDYETEQPRKPLQIIRVSSGGGQPPTAPPVTRVYSVNDYITQQPRAPLQVIQVKAGGGVVVGAPAVIKIVKLPLHEYFKDYGKYDIIFSKPVSNPPPVIPGLVTSVKRFNVTTAIAGSTVVVPHGLIFKPRIILMSIGGETAVSGTTTGQRSYKKGFGAAISYAGVITQYCFGTHSDLGVNPTQADATVRNDAICSVMAAGSASPDVTAGRLAVQSIDSVNVTFVINEQFDANYSLQVQFIGGTDLTSLALFNDTAPAAIGAKSYTNPGFNPDFLLFFGGHLSQAFPDVENDSSTFIGAADKNLNQWVWSGGVNDAAGPASARAETYCRAGECISVLGTAVNPPDCRATLQSIDPLGFTLNWTKIITTNGRKFICLAVQGGNWSVGNFLTPADHVNHQVVSGLPYKPIGEVFVSAGKPASALDTLDAHELLSVGFAQDSTIHGNEAAGQKNITAPTVTYTGISDANEYLNLDITGAPSGLGSVVSVQSDGFTWNQGTLDPVQAFVGYITFGAIVPGPYHNQIITVKPNGGGNYLSLQAALAGELAAHKNLISQNIVLEFDCYAGVDVTPVTITGQNNTGGNGYITDSQHYIYIKCVQGHNGFPDVLGLSSYILDITSTGISGILIQNEYVRFKQFQIRMNVASGNGGFAGYFMASSGMFAPTYWEFVNCIAIANFTNGAFCDGFKTPSAGAVMDAVGVTSVMANCVTYDFLSRDASFSGFNTALTTLQLHRRYNCTAYNCSQGFQDHADVIDINCAAIGCDNGWNTSTGPNAASDYNFSTCGPAGINGAYYPGTLSTSTLDAKGAHSANGLPVYMVDPDSYDIRPEGGDTSLVGQGKNLSADPDFPFNYDVQDNIRTVPWTIGAFQPNRPVIQGVHWHWVGGVTDILAKINIKLNLTEPNVFLKVGLLADLSDGQLFGPAATNANNVVQFIIATTPNTKYYYQVVVASVPYGKIASFSSFPVVGKPASFVLACGGCSDIGSNSNIFNAIKAKNPLVFIEYGDLHYWNIDSNTVALFRLGYDTVGQTPKRARLYDAVARDYMWDDHDFGKDNSDGTSPSKPAAESSYRESVPSYPLPSLIGQVYHSFLIGRVRCVVTDLRSERSPNANIDNASKTMMGPEQLAWFYNELLTAKANSQFILWFTTTPWIAPSGDNNSDDWGGFATERQAIANFIQANALDGIMLTASGDMHSAVIDDGTNDIYTSDGKGNHVPYFLPFPLNQTTQTYGGNWTQGPFVHNGTRLMGFAGIITVTDNGYQLKIQTDVINELGTVTSFCRVYNYPFSVFTLERPSGVIYLAEGAPFSSQFTGETPAATNYTVEVPVNTRIDETC
jgi:alkaline phosphatase D